MARILLGVSGGIAAYKTVELTRLAIKAGHSLRVVATASAGKFVGSATFEGITGAPVLHSEFDHDPLRGAYPGETPPAHLPIAHLAIAERADAYLVAPATAGTVAKLAAGLADSALTTAFLVCRAPRLVAPAMNDRMYRDQATQANLERLRSRGVTVLDPGHGSLASKGEFGEGRLPEPAELMAALETALTPDSARAAPWRGRRVLITAGGTREPLDPVRYLGNRSSGRMGCALAEAARDRGAEVTLIAANLAIAPPKGVSVIAVETTAELAAACHEHFERADLLVMAAAPADFRPAQNASHKLRRGEEAIQIELEPTEDILAGLAASARPDQTLVGFAAELGLGGVDRAREKLVRKKVDLIVFNDVANPEIGFDSSQNAVTMISADASESIGPAPKPEIATSILDRVEALGGGADSTELY